MYTFILFAIFLVMVGWFVIDEINYYKENMQKEKNEIVVESKTDTIAEAKTDPIPDEKKDTLKNEILNKIDFLRNNGVNVIYVNESRDIQPVIFRHECLMGVTNDYFNVPMEDVKIYMNYHKYYINRLLTDAVWYVAKRNRIMKGRQENKEISYIKEYLNNQNDSI